MICDYGTGILAEPVRRRLIDCLSRRAPDTLVVVDAHDPRPWAELEPDLVTPNAQEAARLLDLRLPAGPERAAVVRSTGAAAPGNGGAGRRGHAGPGRDSPDSGRRQFSPDVGTAG